MHLKELKLKKSSLESHHSALNSLSKLLNIKDEITRVEAYDNSHTFGKNSVGVMIVADKEGLSPKHYRKFNIRYDLKEKKFHVLMITI